MHTKYIALLITIFLLASCGGTNEEEVTQTPETTTQETSVNEESLQTTENEEIVAEEETNDSETPETPSETPIKEEDKVSVKDLILAKQKEKEMKEEMEQKEEEPTPENNIDQEEERLVEETVIEEEKEENSLPDDGTDEKEEEEEESTSKVIELPQAYTSPAGEENVVFTINVEGGIITDVDVTPKWVENQISQKRIDAFAQNIDAVVEGKTLEEAQNISVVGGSSLTTDAFTAALKNM